MAARMLMLLLLVVPIAGVSDACADQECLAEDDDPVSLLAHRSSGHRRRRKKCSAETGIMTTETPVNGSGPVVSMVTVDGYFEVNLVVGGGSDSTVEVLADSGLQKYLDVGVSSSGELSIKFSAGMPCGDITGDPKVTVTSPSLPENISASNHAQVNFPKWPFKLNSDIEASVKSLSLTAASSAQIEVKKVSVLEAVDITVDHAKVDTQWTVLADTAPKPTKITATNRSQVQGGSTTKLTVDASDKSKVKYTVNGSASGSVTSGSELKLKVKKGEAAPDYSAVTKDSSSKIKIDYD